MKSFDKMKPSVSIFIFLLILISAVIYYYMYLPTIEKFTTTAPAPSVPSSTAQPVPSVETPEATSAPSLLPLCRTPPDPTSNKSIMSRYFGIGFNIEYIKQQDNDYYLIKHIPTISTGTLGGCYAITADNLLTIKLKNEIDDFQLWSITENIDSKSEYYTIQPKTISSYALQYENGNLSLRPFNSSNVFEAQKWVFSSTEITGRIPVLNYSPGSLFTSEFDPYASLDDSPNYLSDTNSQQVNEVINAVKSGIRQYLGKLDITNQRDQVSSSSLGQRDSPLNINLNLSSKAKQISDFKNVDPNGKNLSDSEFESIMDKYGVSSSNDSRYTPLYKTNDLENEINKIKGCKQINLNDYTSNRVGKCNCKL